MNAYLILRAADGGVVGDLLDEDVAGLEEEGLICHILRQVEMAPLRVVRLGREA